MLFFSLLTIISMLIELFFVSFATAAGLYYMAELAEEYCHLMKKIIFWTIIASTLSLIGLWLFENLPMLLFVPAVLSLMIYYTMLNKFPTIKIASVSFISSIALLAINHFVALRYFTAENYHIIQVFAYFVICIWSVPFLLFISLSTDDYSLPLTNEQAPLVGHTVKQTTLAGGSTSSHGLDNYFLKTQPAKKYKLLSIYHYVKESVPIFGNKKFY